MTLVTEIEDWFHKEKASAEKLLQRIEPLLSEAEPIVKDIAEVASTVGVAEGNPLLVAVGHYLQTALTDQIAVGTFLAANQHVPTANLLHNAAVLALQHTSGNTAAEVSDLDTAVQVAYATVKESAAAK